MGRDCKYKADGHEDTTTFEDRKGGSELRLKKANKEWCLVDELSNSAFKLNNRNLINQTKIKTNLKVTFTRLFTNNLLSSSLVSNSITYMQEQIHEYPTLSSKKIISPNYKISDGYKSGLQYYYPIMNHL